MKSEITKWVVLISSILVLLSACSSRQAVAWNHGWRTKNIVATRYANKAIGFNVGFTFPGHEYDCDRPELFTFIDEHGGYAYEGGGYPGAPIYAVFKGVTDRDSADRLLPSLLPEFEMEVRKFW